MIIIDKVKNLKIYKTQLFFPTLKDDKKRKSAILLMTPNYESSKKIIKSNLFINRLRYSSYYMKRDVSYYINTKSVDVIEEGVSINDKGFTVPNTCPECNGEVKVYIKGEPVYLCSKCNKYFGTVPFKEDIDILSEKDITFLPESCINTGDKILLFNEDINDTQLYKMIYRNRLRQRKDIIALYNQVKADLPEIKYTFPEIDKYNGKNLFIDLYFYNKLFFDNNTWVMNKGLNLYLTYMSRLIDDPEIKSAGYINKTIIIPVTDWCQDPMVWNFKKFLNPMSVIYQLMMNNNSKLLSTFGNTNIIFTSKDKYFKINFSEIDLKELPKIATKFKMFLIKMVKNEEFDSSDVDTTSDNVESSEVIKANIIDKIELAKGVDLTANVSKFGTTATPKKIVKKSNSNTESNTKEKSNNVSKLSDNNIKSDAKKKKESDIENLSATIARVADTSNSEEDAWDALDNDAIKKIIIDLDSISDDKPDITQGRSNRLNQLSNELLNKEIKGRSIKDILEPEVKENPIPTISLDIATPTENWTNLKFANFDKNYDIDKDIVRCFKHFEECSRAIAIRNIEVTDNSTSEDRVELYKVEMEDYRGKRFTIKLDIPIMVDNRFLLRGNNKSIQTQFFNMPIIKSDIDTCQIVSNYMKIFIRRFGEGTGKSLPIVSKFIKAANKYTGRKIKFTIGDNTKVCYGYELPIDYIDISGSFSTIETDTFIIYFNQDDIRNIYSVDINSNGFPIAYNKKTKSVEYFYYNSQTTFINKLIELIEIDGNEDFISLFMSSSSSSISAYSKCSIMNSQIPLIIICAYHEGLRKTLEKAKVNYRIVNNLTKEDRSNYNLDWIKFKDGYVIYESTYESSLLMNGLKTCSTELFELADIDNKNMYLEFLDNFGGRIKADGLDNFYDLLVDPMTKDSLEFYKFPTDYVSILLYSNALLADNGFIKHTDTSSRKLRRYMLIAVYTYKVLSDAYASYANQLRHNREAAEFSLKQSAVIDKFLTDTITSDDSCINALRDLETTNSITTKGPSGMNSDRAYSLDKRTFDDSMLNVVGMSTGFAANVGITRQATLNSNIDDNGYVISINGDTNKMNVTGTLTATEALTPFSTTHDDPMRVAMTFIQTSKHMVRTEDSDPLLVTNGSDEAMPYISGDKFAFKSKKAGKVEEITEDYIMLSYEDGTKDFVSIKESIEKNSDGGYYVPLKLDIVDGLKVGSKIKPNQIIAYDKYSFSNSLGESDNIAYNIGKLAKIAIINTDEGFEDSGVCTERLAEKLATRINLQYSATLDKNTNVLSMLKVGDKVECGDPLMIWQAPFDDADANSLMKTLAGDDVSDLGKKKLKSEVTGVVKGIKIFRTIELEDMSDSLRKIVDNYEKPLRALYKKLKDNNLDTSQVPAHYNLPPTGKLKKAMNSVVIEYYVEYIDTVGVGDKIVYFAANKAVEKSVIPKGKEPYTDFRPNEMIDGFVSEVSIDKRLVTSIPIIGSITKAMIELDRSVKDIMGIPYDDSTV